MYTTTPNIVASTMLGSGVQMAATTPNNVATCSASWEQGVQMDVTCNIQQCWELLVSNVASVCTQPKFQ